MRTYFLHKAPIIFPLSAVFQLGTTACADECGVIYPPTEVALPWAATACTERAAFNLGYVIFLFYALQSPAVAAPVARGRIIRLAEPQPGPPDALGEPTSVAIQHGRQEKQQAKGGADLGAHLSVARPGKKEIASNVANDLHWVQQHSASSQRLPMQQKLQQDRSWDTKALHQRSPISESSGAPVASGQRMGDRERVPEVKLGGPVNAVQPRVTAPRRAEQQQIWLQSVGSPDQQAASAQPSNTCQPQRLHVKADALLALLGVRKPSSRATEGRHQGQEPEASSLPRADALLSDIRVSPHPSHLEVLQQQRTQPYNQIQGVRGCSQTTTIAEHEGEGRACANVQPASGTQQGLMHCCYADGSMEVQRSQNTGFWNTYAPASYATEQQVTAAPRSKHHQPEAETQPFRSNELQNSQPFMVYPEQQPVSVLASQRQQLQRLDAKADALLAILGGKKIGNQRMREQRERWQRHGFAHADPLPFEGRNTYISRHAQHLLPQQPELSQFGQHSQVSLQTSQLPFSAGEQLGDIAEAQRHGIPGVMPSDAGLQRSQRGPPPSAGQSTAQLLLRLLHE